MTRLLVATDLDGTLLDEATYRWDLARPALAALERSGAELVLASSKSRAEMEPLAREIGLSPALIVENGGALLVPASEGGYDTLVRGTARAVLVRALAEIAGETGATVAGFASFSPERVAELTGLDPAAAARALEREYDEPFLLRDERAAESVSVAAMRRGLAVTRGGRFFHLTGDVDKGGALRRLLAYHAAAGRRFRTIALGDAGNDLPLLRAVDRPVVVPRPSGAADPVLAAALPAAELAPLPGPAGWNVAVLALLAGETLPRVGRGGSP